MAFSICAIMSAYNEEDVIEESIEKLIAQGLDVYLIDNKSTDKTVERAKKFLGRGLIDIETLVFYENDKEVYNWTGILERKELLSKQLNHDWFIHTDADEIRYSPWPGTTLKDSINEVDKLGFNLINFKLFDFKITNPVDSGEPVEQKLQYYAEADSFNSRQVKAWKKCSEIDLVTYGGHLAKVADPRLFPIRFILKHYPVRSIEQGTKKILNERLARYSKVEKAKNWHVQYDHYSREAKKLPKELLVDESKLEKFCPLRANLELNLECAKAFSMLRELCFIKIDKFEKDDYGMLPVTPNVTQSLISILKGLSSDILAGKEPEKHFPEDVGYTINRLLKKRALSEFLTGKADFFDKLLPWCTTPGKHRQQ